MAKSASKKGKSEFIEFEQGEQVEHPLWGIGTIVMKIGTGENQKVEVVFTGEGNKRLSVRHANLKRVI